MNETSQVGFLGIVEVNRALRGEALQAEMRRVVEARRQHGMDAVTPLRLRLQGGRLRLEDSDGKARLR